MSLKNDAETFDNLEAEVTRLRAALLKAVETIQVWHNMGVPKAECSTQWHIYWCKAPEMKAIRDALSTSPNSGTAP